jgi:hypothetical protein
MTRSQSVLETNNKSSFNIINWNIAGAKYLEEKKKINRDNIRNNINNALDYLIFENKPHIITLQECVQYGVRANKSDDNFRNDEIIDIIDIEKLKKGISIGEGKTIFYNYFYFPLIDTDTLSAQVKWNKVRTGSDWPKTTFFSQGNGLLIRDDMEVRPVLDLSNEVKKINKRGGYKGKKIKNNIEQIFFGTGLYMGNRDTERRSALVVHLVFNTEENVENQGEIKILDIFIINTHLTTLKSERDGLINSEKKAVSDRLNQLEIIVNGIFNRYNTWREEEAKKEIMLIKRTEPLWILTGDFNFTPFSPEYKFLESHGFQNLHQQNNYKPTKSLKYGEEPLIINDYIFITSKNSVNKPLFQLKDFGKNYVYDWNNQHIRGISDHYPLFASIPIKEDMIMSYHK